MTSIRNIFATYIITLILILFLALELKTAFIRSLLSNSVILWSVIIISVLLLYFSEVKHHSISVIIVSLLLLLPKKKKKRKIYARTVRVRCAMLIVIASILGLMLVWLYESRKMVLEGLSAFYELLESFFLSMAKVIMESAVYLTATIPSIFSLFVLKFAVTHVHDKTENNNEWNGVESLIKRMDPSVNLVALAADVGGFLAAQTFFSPKVSGFVTAAFIVSMVTIFLAFTNWYLTGVVFKHSEFSTSHGKFFIVENNNNRYISWALLNSVSILLIWVLWVITVVGVVTIF